MKTEVISSLLITANVANVRGNNNASRNQGRTTTEAITSTTTGPIDNITLHRTSILRALTMGNVKSVAFMDTTHAAALSSNSLVVIVAQISLLFPPMPHGNQELTLHPLIPTTQPTGSWTAVRRTT